jgi:membrane protein
MWSSSSSFQQQWLRLLRGLSRATRISLTVAARTVRSTFSPECSLIAASISYFTLLSLFPLTLITVAIASIWIEPQLAEAEIVRQLEFVAPGIQRLLGDNLEAVVETRGPITGFALLALTWSASHVFQVLNNGLNKIWQVDESRPVWRHRGLSILFALLLSGLLLSAMAAQGVFAEIQHNLPWPEPPLYLRVLGHDTFYTTLSIFGFSCLYYFLPHRRLRWREVLPGAIVAGYLWELAKQGFLAVVTVYLSRTNLVYGSVATIIAFMTWTYFSSIIFLMGAYLNINYQQLRASRRPATVRQR